jgi:hypothetical protein
MLIRPLPPEHLLGGMDSFEPAPEVMSWARQAFINEGAGMEVDELAHLQQASIGFLWTNVPNTRRDRMLLGTCALMPPNGDKWSAGRSLAQIREWFPDGEDIDFLITLYAPAAFEMDDASFCALVLHELLHAGQKRDNYGQPQFQKETGKPVWALRGHDLEEFVTVARMFGAQAAGADAFVQAALEGPTVSRAQMNVVCGNCLRLVG